MGNLFSSSTKKDKNDKSENVEPKLNVPDNKNQSYKIYKPEQHDQRAIKYLKERFNNDTEEFILNQMLMCYMFFGDYAEDIKQCAALTSGDETLIKEYQKELILPDTILETLCKKFQYQPLEGPKRNETLPFLSQRMYVIHNNVEIEDQQGNYTIIDKPYYQAKIEESREHKGFVRVNMLQSNGSRSSSGSVKTDSSEDKPSDINCQPSTSTGVTQNDSGFNTESDYDYATITAATTPQKLNVVDPNIYTDIFQLPSKCFETRRCKNINAYDSESENEDSNNAKKPPSLYIKNSFLNSYEFMLYFRDNVFPNYLGDVLNFPLTYIDQATSVAGSIFCDSVDKFSNVVNYEVIPAIAISWPQEIAFEWILRERPIVNDKISGIKYIWPTTKMIDNAKKLKCVVVPRGFLPKKGKNRNMELEWEVCFPKVERYLELRMSHAQMRVFLFILILFRTLIEPKTQKHGLLVEHIRHLMFWECEANYKDWPLDQLGVKLIQVLNRLYECLSEQKLSHYFIKERNLFENIPSRYIFQTLEDIIKVKESPVIHMLRAFKEIKSIVSGKFYPELDLDELYNIISSASAYDKEVQRSITSYDQIKQKDIKKETKMTKEDKWNRRYLEAQRRKHELKMIKKAIDVKEQKPPPQQMKLEMSIQKRFQGDTMRQIRLLTFFIRQFINIARRSFKLSSTDQTLLYLKQAWYLTKILEDFDIKSALESQQQIKEIEENCQKKRVTEPKIPKTPSRNTYTSDITDTNTNMTKLSKIYNENLYQRLSEEKKAPLEPKVKVNSVGYQTESDDDVTSEKPATPSTPLNKKDETMMFFETDNKSDTIEFTSL